MARESAVAWISRRTTVLHIRAEDRSGRRKKSSKSSNRSCLGCGQSSGFARASIAPSTLAPAVARSDCNEEKQTACQERKVLLKVKRLEAKRIRKREEAKRDSHSETDVKLTRGVRNVLQVFAAEKGYWKTLKNCVGSSRGKTGEIPIPA